MEPVFDYISYYGLENVPEKGEGINVAVLDGSWLMPDPNNIFGKMAKQVDGKGEAAVKTTGFHGIMVSTLINGQPNPAVQFYGGAAPSAVVHLIDISELYDEYDLSTCFEIAVRRAHLILRAGNFEHPKHGWKQADTEKIYQILEKYDALLILTAGNAGGEIGHTHESQWMNYLVEHEKIMQRVLIVANFRPLPPSEAAIGMKLMRARILVDTYPGQDKVDNAILENMLTTVMNRPLARATIRKWNVTTVQQLNDKLQRLPYHCEKGKAESYTAGIMHKHCVFVTGCDIHTIGRFGQMESNTGSSESAPIMTGMLARFVQRHKTLQNTHADVLRLFKQHYCESLGNTAIWGLGEPNVTRK